MIAWDAPQWFIAFLGVPLLIGFFIWVARRRSKMAQVFAIYTDTVLVRRMVQAGCYVLAYVFIVLALAGPRWGYHWQEMHRQGVDLFVALDLSKSMLAQDVKPSRLERAKIEISDMLDALPSDRVGIIAFSGESFMACPLTLDHEVAKMFLDDLKVGQIDRGGTDIGSAVQRALKSFTGEDGAHKAIVLVSDGEDLEGRGLAIARKAKEAGVKIFCVGIGSATGAPIPVHDEEGHQTFLKDRAGQTVVSKLGGESLQKIALETGGAYAQISGGAFQMASLYKNEISKMDKADFGETRKKVFESRFQWALSVALLLLVAGFIMEDRVMKRKASHATVG